MHTAIEAFTGKEVSANTIQRSINHPANAINIEINANLSMDKRLAWGIEAKLVNNEVRVIRLCGADPDIFKQWKYYFRAVKPYDIYATIRLNDGDEIKFGKGDDGATIELPDPQLCNLHLAVARVFTALGFAEVVEKFETDNEGDTTTEFGDELSRRLARMQVFG